MNDRDFAKLYDRLVQAEFAESRRWKDLSGKERTVQRMLYDKGRSDGYDEGEKDGRAAWEAQAGAVREAIERIETQTDTRLGHADPVRFAGKRPAGVSAPPRPDTQEIERLRAQIAERDAVISGIRKLAETLQELAMTLSKASAPPTKLTRPTAPVKRK